jgi:elongation factor Ts
MTTITASMVAQLRARTDAPMMECKKALSEVGGDMDKAEELIRVKLGNKASKAASRITAEGIVAVAQDAASTSLVELNCETDFVAKNDDFLSFANGVASLIVTHNPTDIEALSALTLACSGQTVEASRTALIGKIGENITIRRFSRIETNSQAIYLHGSKIGVIVEYTGSELAAKDAAMQIAAMKPVALTPEEVSPEIIAKERSIAEQKAAESGKPAEFISKMVEGTIQKFLKEVALLSQPFVKNDKQTVQEILKANNTIIHKFIMFVVGEGIEKKVDDFAAEVAAQVAASQQA